MNFTERNAISGSLPVEPERDPGEYDEEDAGPVDLYQEVAHVPLEVKRHEQHRELCNDRIFGERVINSKISKLKTEQDGVRSISTSLSLIHLNLERMMKNL